MKEEEFRKSFSKRVESRRQELKKKLSQKKSKGESEKAVHVDPTIAGPLDPNEDKNKPVSRPVSKPVQDEVISELKSRLTIVDLDCPIIEVPTEKKEIKASVKKEKTQKSKPVEKKKDEFIQELEEDRLENSFEAQEFKGYFEKADEDTDDLYDTRPIHRAKLKKELRIKERVIREMIESGEEGDPSSTKVVIDLAIRFKSLIVQSQAVTVFVTSYVQNQVSDFIETEFIAKKIRKYQNAIFNTRRYLFRERSQGTYKNSELDVYRRQLDFLESSLHKQSEKFVKSFCFRQTYKTFSDEEASSVVEVLGGLLRSVS